MIRQLVICVLAVSSGCGGSDPQAEALKQLAFTVGSSEKSHSASLVNGLKEQSVILKLKVDPKRLISEMYVLPSFDQLDVDQKSSVIRLCYFDVFGLPRSTKKFPGLMYLMDGRTGDQLRTVDLDLRGLRFD